MIELPKLTGREFRPWDWYGWFMSIFGLLLIAYWSNNNEITWFNKIGTIALIAFITLEYFWRVVYGRIYKHVYYDTIIHKLYEVEIGEDTYFICAETEDELKLYIEIHYPFISNRYKIIKIADVESFIKKELYQ